MCSLVTIPLFPSFSSPLFLPFAALCLELQTSQGFCFFRLCFHPRFAPSRHMASIILVYYLNSKHKITGMLLSMLFVLRITFIDNIIVPTDSGPFPFFLFKAFSFFLAFFRALRSEASPLPSLREERDRQQNTNQFGPYT